MIGIRSVLLRVYFQRAVGSRKSTPRAENPNKPAIRSTTIIIIIKYSLGNNNNNDYAPAKNNFGTSAIRLGTTGGIGTDTAIAILRFYSHDWQKKKKKQIKFVRL